MSCIDQNVRRTAGKVTGFSLAALCVVPLALQSLETARAESLQIPPEPVRGKGYRLVKDWNFVANIQNEAQLRQEFYTRYVYSGGKLDHLKGEWQRYRENQNHVFTDQGLALVARVRKGVSDGNVESGMLRSKWTGKYGYFEARMKVPSGRGLWPAFWLNPEDQKWPPEIDVVEIVDNGRDTTKASFHILHGIGTRNTQVSFSRLDKWFAYRPGFDYADGFHTFAVEWTQDGVKHYVDNALVNDRSYAWKHDDGADAGPAHVLLNLAVGGSWPGAPVDARVFPAQLVIDYVRVWQR